MFPNRTEPTRRQGSVAGRRVDGAVAGVGLQRSGIDALIGQRVTAGMPKHVGVDLEPNLGFVAGASERLGAARRVPAPPRFDKNTNGEAD
jgi:hypothetical protein